MKKKISHFVSYLLAFSHHEDMKGKTFDYLLEL